MKLHLFDTDTLSLFRHGNPNVVAEARRVGREHLAISVISVEEQLTGWYSLLRNTKRPEEIVIAYGQLAETVLFLSTLPILPFSAEAAATLADLRRQKIRIGTLDLRIASIALVHDAVLVTRNRRHFGLVPGLTIEDWTASE